MPRLPPVTTATAPFKFKTASLSVEFASELGESIAVSGPDQTMCTTHPNPMTACDLPPEPKITLTTQPCAPKFRDWNATIPERFLTVQYVCVNCTYICSYWKWAYEQRGEKARGRGSAQKLDGAGDPFDFAGVELLRLRAHGTDGGVRVRGYEPGYFVPDLEADGEEWRRQIQVGDL